MKPRKLAPRQQEALSYQARGYSYGETALAMDCSVANVANLLRECFFKLHAANTREAIARAMQKGLIHICLVATVFSSVLGDTDLIRVRLQRKPNSQITRLRNREDIA